MKKFTKVMFITIIFVFLSILNVNAQNEITNIEKNQTLSTGFSDIINKKYNVPINGREGFESIPITTEEAQESLRLQNDYRTKNSTRLY